MPEPSGSTGAVALALLLPAYFAGYVHELQTLGLIARPK